MSSCLFLPRASSRAFLSALAFVFVKLLDLFSVI
uniref:Sig3 n=1 Tax=Arundo donax TaxID=35708 RepID=A0A0A9B957_ARUDO